MGTNIEITKQLLVACDQSYFTSKDQVLNQPLHDLFDRANDAPAEHGNPEIYAPYPKFTITPGYFVVAAIDRTDRIGAKALIYRNATTNDVIVAFGGTDGISAQDWTTNTQDVGWKQWVELNTTRAQDLGVLDWLSFVQTKYGPISHIHFTGQSLGVNK